MTPAIARLRARATLSQRPLSARRGMTNTAQGVWRTTALETLPASAPYRAVRTRAEEQQINVRVNELEDGTPWVGPEQHSAFDGRLTTDLRQGRVERVLRRLLLALKRLATLDRDQRLEPRQGHELPRDRRRRLDHHQHMERSSGPYREVVRRAERQVRLRRGVERNGDQADIAQLADSMAARGNCDRAGRPVQQPLADGAQQHAPHRTVM